MTARETGVGVLLALALLALNVLWVSASLGFLHKPRSVKETDHLHYIEMAKGPEGRPDLVRDPPFCWRVLVPFLARQLARAGLELNLAFFLVTNLSLLGFLAALCLLLADLGFPPAERMAGLLIAGLTQGAVRWYEYQYWMTDPLCLFLVTLAFLLLRRERWLALGAVCLLAAFVRETYVIAYPWVFFRVLRKEGLPRALARTAALAALPILATVALRVLIVPVQPEELGGRLREMLAFRWRHLLDNQLYVLTIGSFGVLVPLLLLYPARLLALARERPGPAAVVAVVYLSLAVQNNTERPLAYALPVLLPAGLLCLRWLAAEARWRAGATLALAVGLQAVFFSQQRFLESGMSLYQPTNLLVAAAMALAWALGRLGLLRARRA